MHRKHKGKVLQFAEIHCGSFVTYVAKKTFYETIKVSREEETFL